MKLHPFISGALIIIGAAACAPQTPKQTIESELGDISSRTDNLNLRLNKIEKTAETLSKSMEEQETAARQARADQSVAVEDLRTELKTLGGALDVLKHDLAETERQHQKYREDFDLRLAEIDQKLQELQANPKPKSGAAGGDDIAQYNRILQIFRERKDYGTAIRRFQEFIRDYPDSRLAANAQYWIGEGYYAQGDYARAITEFQAVSDKYPQNEKVCDALLKQGLAFGEIKEREKARLFLTETREKCPKTRAATTAAQQLGKLAAPPTNK